MKQSTKEIKKHVRAVAQVDGIKAMIERAAQAYKGEAIDGEKLQEMYDAANWSGYANYNGEKWHTSRIQDGAKRSGVKLEYNCPA